MTEVTIHDQESLEKAKKQIIKDGANNFHVIADFDRTLTKAFHGSTKTRSIIAHLRNGEYLTEDYAPRAHALFDEYHPIEIDADVDMKIKKIKMKEWWIKHFDLLIEVGLDKKTIKRAVKDMIDKRELRFREGVEDFLKLLKNKNIPLIIMSASVGDMIIEFLKQKNVYSDNIHVVSNLLEWDKNGRAKEIKEIIHVFNKTEVEVNVSDIQNRKNVLLIGDSMGDVGMIEGFDYDNLIKIGFLNENVDENLEWFKQNYDIVLLGDGDFSFINDFVEEIK